MTFDQAQSPRLGQRTPVESTYVQIFDVDPGTETADLVEAAWPGMLIYRQDRSILQIFDGDADAWADVAGGVAGQLTYVGPTMPTGASFNLGDTWYDTDDEYQAYVWDGDSWEPSAGGNRTYYADGWDPASPDPDNPDLIPLAGEFVVGDLWYQTDDNNHPYRWNGLAWISIRDPDLANIETNADAIAALDAQVQEAEWLAQSANNTADTADGRVSMSDYVPGPDDVTYAQTRKEADPDTGEEIDVTYEIARTNGSIWFTRTRIRRNYCTNPSFEADLADWTQIGCTQLRVPALGVPAGLWTSEVTNSGVASDHIVRWSPATRAACQEGEHWTASIFAELVSGTSNGTTIAIRWFDAAGAVISVEVGDPMDLVEDAWDPVLAGTIAEPRLWVTGIAPVGAASLDVQLTSPAGNEGAVWHTGAMLVEKEDDLGRYFDGDSYDGHWDGTQHNSVSYLEGDKIQQVWELRDGDWERKYLTDTTLGSINAGKLIGSLFGGLLTEGTVIPTAMAVAQVQASEALSAGDVVNVWNSAGSFRVRKANATLRYQAHGFVWKACANGAMASVYHSGYNPFCINLAPGTQWLSPSAGKVTTQPPSGVGQLVQSVGFAPSSGVLDFAPGIAIRII